MAPVLIQSAQGDEHQYWTDPILCEETRTRLEHFRSLGWLPPNFKPRTLLGIAVIERYWRKFCIQSNEDYVDHLLLEDHAIYMNFFDWMFKTSREKKLQPYDEYWRRLCQYFELFARRRVNEDAHKQMRRLYVLRTMNGNPVSTIENVKGLLDEIEKLGQQFLRKTKYRFMSSESSSNRLQSLELKLDSGLRAIFGDKDYIAVIYGSSALRNNALLSDIDLMVFARDADPALCKALEAMFRSTMGEEGILIDAEVPFERKLLVPIQLAAKAARSGPPLDEAGHVLSIRQTAEYLASDEMLKRLVFNVLTTPNKVFSASGGSTHDFKQLEQDAADNLVDLIRRVNPGKVNTAEDFVRFAISDGPRSGEEYLGYKPRDNVVEKLRQIFKDAIESHGLAALRS